MGNKIKQFGRAVRREMTENRNTFLVYAGMRLLVIVIMVLQALNRNYQNVFLCFLTLLLMLLPSVAQAAFKVELPSTLEIILLCFIFAAEILGEISSFYLRFSHWDTILHTLNGFLCAGVGFSLVDTLNRQRRMKFELSPIFLVITAFCFSMTIGVLWEMFEYGMDMMFALDMQKDTIVSSIYSTLPQAEGLGEALMVRGIADTVVNGKSLGLGGYLDIGLIDTMNDLIVNFIGAFVFCLIGYICIKKKKYSAIVESLVPEPWTEEKRNQAGISEQEIAVEKRI